MKIRNIPEELFKPVYFRAQETKRPDGIIKDELAVKLVEQILPIYPNLMTGRYSLVSLSILC